MWSYLLRFPVIYCGGRHRTYRTYKKKTINFDIFLTICGPTRYQVFIKAPRSSKRLSRPSTRGFSYHLAIRPRVRYFVYHAIKQISKQT